MMLALCVSFLNGGQRCAEESAIFAYILLDLSIMLLFGYSFCSGDSTCGADEAA